LISEFKCCFIVSIFIITGSMHFKIAKQAFQLALWIVVSQLKTVLNDNSNALCKDGHHN